MWLVGFTEAWAAKEAGLQVVLSVREGTVPLAQRDLETFPTITSFTQLLPPSSSSSSPAKKPKKTLEVSEKKEEGKGNEGNGNNEVVEKGNGEKEEKNGVKC